MRAESENTSKIKLAYQKYFVLQNLGKTLFQKKLFFRALPELASPTPIQATWSSFFRTSKQCFACMTVKSTIDYDHGCNDHYNSNDGNFDDNDDKKHTKIISFE